MKKGNCSGVDNVRDCKNSKEIQSLLSRDKCSLPCWLARASHTFLLQACPKWDTSCSLGGCDDLISFCNSCRMGSCKVASHPSLSITLHSECMQTRRGRAGKKKNSLTQSEVLAAAWKAAMTSSASAARKPGQCPSKASLFVNRHEAQQSLSHCWTCSQQGKKGERGKEAYPKWGTSCSLGGCDDLISFRCKGPWTIPWGVLYITCCSFMASV